jgi:hypothetical protein
MSIQSRNPDDLEKTIGTPASPGKTPDCRQYDMRIARDGTWFHQGGPIKRMALVKLFSTVLRRDESGDFWLVTPVERGRIEVEDAPFVAVELHAEGAGKAQMLRLRTNLDHWVTVGASHPIRVTENPDTREPAPYVLVRDNLEARISRAVFYELAELAEPADPVEPSEPGTDGENAMLGVWSAGVFFALGPAE